MAAAFDLKAAGVAGARPRSLAEWLFFDIRRGSEYYARSIRVADGLLDDAPCPSGVNYAPFRGRFGALTIHAVQLGDGGPVPNPQMDLART